jgi:hypothetical protein
MKKEIAFWAGAVPVLVSILIGALDPPPAMAVPSYARQTGLACNGCHYAPPELNPAGRKFKLLGYVDRGDETKTVKSEAGKAHAALDLLASLPLSVMFETSFTSLKSPEPATQNGSFEFPQDVSLFLSGAWTSHVGSFMQMTYDTQDDHFTIDNTDVRFANKTKLGGKELIYGLDFNNNPTVEDVWNSTPAWGYPWIASDWAPVPAANPLINNGLAQDVAGIGGYAMWNDHFYADLAIYRSQHVGVSQPNSGIDDLGNAIGYNIRGVAPYWRLAFQELTGKTQYEVGTFGMHVRSTPGSITGAEDEVTDWGVDWQIDQTLWRRHVLSFRGSYIRENANFCATLAQCGTTPPAGQPNSNHLNTFLPNVEFHYGNRLTGTFGWFETSGTANMGLYSTTPPVAVSNSANGDPRSAGYLLNVSYWPWQNLQLAAQYTGYTRFNGGSTNYDGLLRNASGNNTVYLDAKFLF